MEDLGFGEDRELIDYVLNHISEENKKGLTSEKIESVLDFMLDFFESKGYLDESNIDSDQEVEIDEGEMSCYIMENIERASIALTVEQVDEILDLEYQFNQEDGVYD